MEFVLSVNKAFWKHPFSFTGRASRGEYWVLLIVLALILLARQVFLGNWGERPGAAVALDLPHRFYLLGTLGVVINLCVIVVSCAISVRRAHDIGMSGRKYLGIICGVAIVAQMILQDTDTALSLAGLASLLVGFFEGHWKENEYGPVPHSLDAEVPHREGQPFAGRRAALALGVVVLAGGVDLAIGPLLHAAHTRVSFVSLPGQKTMLYQGTGARYGAPDPQVLWAFSFAPEVNVTPVLGTTRVITGINIDKPVMQTKEGFKVYPPTTNQKLRVAKKGIDPIVLLYALPEFTNLQGTLGGQRLTALQIKLTPETHRYDKRDDWGSKPSFVARFEKYMQFECVADGDIAPGITRLREPSKQEAAQIMQAHRDRGPRFELRKGCLSKSAESGAGYAVFDAKGKPSGFGNCRNFGTDPEGDNCAFTFWLSRGLIAEYRFAGRHIGKLREIDQFVRQQLDAATVNNVAKDIHWF